MEDQKIKEILIEKSEAFRRLYLRHQEMEAKLLQCQGRQGRSEEDLQEETEIKKRKLKLKDDMQKQIFSFRQRLA
jgi:uncharacterized protein YdcH (DUF465 family)